MSWWQSLKQTFSKSKSGKGSFGQQQDVSPEEKQLIMGRLAATNIHAVAHTQTADRLADDIIEANRRVEAFDFNNPGMSDRGGCRMDAPAQRG